MTKEVDQHKYGQFLTSLFMTIFGVLWSLLGHILRRIMQYVLLDKYPVFIYVRCYLLKILYTLVNICGQ